MIKEKKESETEQIKFILNQLIKVLNPSNNGVKRFYYWDSEKEKKFSYSIINSDCIILNNNLSFFIPFRFTINCTINKVNNKINILGENLDFSFPPEMLLTVYKKFKKIKN